MRLVNGVGRSLERVDANMFEEAPVDVLNHVGGDVENFKRFKASECTVVNRDKQVVLEP